MDERIDKLHRAREVLNEKRKAKESKKPIVVTKEPSAQPVGDSGNSGTLAIIGALLLAGGIAVSSFFWKKGEISPLKQQGSQVHSPPEQEPSKPPFNNSTALPKHPWD